MLLSNPKIEYPNCPLCRSDDARIIYEHIDSYRVVQCRSCRFYYLSPRPAEVIMERIYQDDSYYDGVSTIGYESYHDQAYSLRATFRRFLLNLKRQGLTGGSLLEVGCGYGFLLDEANGFFDVRIGTELCSEAASMARLRADHIYEGDIGQIPAEEKFDCIVTIHVIEHVYDPQLFLSQFLGHLKPGGKIIIATPDMGSLWRYLLGRRWPSFKLPEHVLFFDKQSLSILMQHNGLTDIQTLPYPHAFPLSLVAKKLYISLPRFFADLTIWIPGTTLAMYGRYYER